MEPARLAKPPSYGADGEMRAGNDSTGNISRALAGAPQPAVHAGDAEGVTTTSSSQAGSTDAQAVIEGGTPTPSALGLVIDLTETQTTTDPQVEIRSGYAGKRLFDVLFACTALALSAPLMALLAMAIKLSSRGSVLFRHERIGRDGTPFTLLKFRTMVAGADQMLESLLAEDPSLRVQFEERFKLAADPRVTRVGRWLRRTSLDELPQFWNVLRGDMSVVGPRPIVTAELLRYGEWQELLLSVRPGITGPWQVSGRNDIDYSQRVGLDLAYARQNGFRTDLGIIARTALRLFSIGSNGAY